MKQSYDLIVIGGGVNGAGIARDAAGRGAKVLLLEARDLANGTSSASTKLVHGGLRYLEYYEFSLVREALKEREVLWAIAPHIVRPLRFILPWLPKSMGGSRPRWMLRLGLFLYDHIGGRRKLRATTSIDLTAHAAGKPLIDGLVRGFEYSDGWVDDARLVALNALDAAEKGADIRTRTPVTGAHRDGDEWVVETPRGTFRGKALANAAGPGADDVARLTGREPPFGVRRVRGSHVVVKKLFDHNYAYIFQMPDTRICFAIPYEDDFTLIGTTDRDHSGSLTEISVGQDEVDYLLENVSHYFKRPVTRDDVVWSYSGVRALIDDGSGRPEAATRGYHLPLSAESDGAPVLGVYGGKITSYRHLAEEAVDKLARRMPALSGKRWTGDAPLPGGDFPMDGQEECIQKLVRAYPFLEEGQARRIIRAYGTRAKVWLGPAKSWDDLGQHFGAGLSEAEVRYLMETEWAETAEDVLWRRSKLGLHMSEAQRDAVRDFIGE